MPLKYKKLVVFFSLGILLIGLGTFAIISPDFHFSFHRQTSDNPARVASFGCLFGTLTGFSPTLCAAIGMAAIFCGVTNSPITSLLISFEMFGFAAMPFLLLAIAFSYMLSGYYGLYRSQKIMYSKFKTSYINKQTH